VTEVPGILRVLGRFAMAAACVGMAGTACQAAAETARENRPVGGIDSIVLRVPGNARVEQGGRESLVIEADKDVLPKLRTEVRGGVLYIEANQSFSTRDPIRFRITVTRLSALASEGGGEVMLGRFELPRLDLKLSGSGTVKKDPATSISQLSMGGGVFYFKQAGYGVAQFGTFYGTEPFENAKVFVNGLELRNALGLFSNVDPLTPALLDNGKPVHIAVYALGDSVTHDIALPESPVFVHPSEDAQLTVGDSLYVGVSYPGAHQIVSMAVSNQDDVYWAAETPQKDFTLSIGGAMLKNAGASTITAASANTSGSIPENFDMNKQYKVFLVSSVASRAVTFVGK
jgi:hypothetical protein